MSNQIETAAYELITGEIADRLLQPGMNKANRRLNNSVVNKYMSDLINGRWQCNGESIKITADGQLLDGQHRLTAIRNTKIAARMLVARNIDPMTIDTIDTGWKRTAAHAIGVVGGFNQKDAGMLASAVKLLLHYENSGNWLALKLSERHAADNGAVSRYTREHRLELAANLEWLKGNFSATGGFMSGGERLFFYTVFARLDPERAKQFMLTIFKGVNVPESGTEFLLRDYMLRTHSKPQLMKRTKSEIRHTLIKNWNRNRVGKNVTSMQSIHATQQDTIYAQ